MENKEIDDEITSENVKLKEQANLVLTGGLPTDQYRHPESLDTAQMVIHKIKDLKSALGEDKSFIMTALI
ncbi:unnamed protein product [Clonostachys rhizophaga]|uniref:Uncharacterized protein n=1 Tax=Clonostachys rhizophaga TaxID=160324 RepID=A0A9N9YM22_9HYPO|nr:unnamed protein product [Clonostachys rhizophaga]